MEKKLNEKFEELSVEKLQEILKRMSAEELKKQECQCPQMNPGENLSVAGAINQTIIPKEEKISPEIKFAEIKTEPSDFTQERVRLERLHQELNTLREKLIQRIELLKTLEKRKKEIDSQLENLSQQLASLKEEDNDFLEEIKNKLENWEI